MSSAIAVPIVVGATLAGGVWFQILVCVVIALAMWEVASMLTQAQLPSVPFAGLLAALAFPLAASVSMPLIAWLFLALATPGGLVYLAVRPQRVGSLAGWAISLALGLYVGLALGPAILLRDRPDGLGWVLLAMIGTWACDSAAYLIGRRWGRHKFAPTVSPQKSVEGVVAGVLGAFVVMLGGYVLWNQPLLRLAGLGLVVAAGAVFGDLAESVIKRQLSAKDSGWIMPGHGGLLDRIDSLLLSGFLAYLYVTMTDGVMAG